MKLRKVDCSGEPGHCYFHCFSIQNGEAVAIVEDKNGRVHVKRHIQGLRFVKRFSYNDYTLLETVRMWVRRRYYRVRNFFFPRPKYPTFGKPA